MATIKDVAEQCGVSISVVSRVLNPRPDPHARIAAKTRQRVVQAARKMGFQRNRAAECLKRGHSQAIGIFLPQIANRLLADLIFGLAQEAAAQGFPLTFSFGMSFAQYRHFVEQAHLNPSCGIISYPYFTLDPRISDLVTAFHRQGHPLVLINAAVAVEGVSVVTMDEAYGGRLAGRRLIAAGCRRLVVYGRYHGRNEGFEAEAATAGLTVESVPADASGMAVIRSAHTAATPTAPLGVFAVTDKDALAVLAAFRHDSLAIGRELRLVGYDDLDMTAYVTPPLTTIRQPFKELGVLAVRRIVDAVDGRPSGSDIVKPELVVRESG